MPAPIEKPPDQTRIVAQLAAECQMPVAEMATLYEHERAEVAVGAHITKYLHILATRKVLDLIRQRNLGQQHRHAAAPGRPAA